ARPQLARDLLVEETGDDPGHDIALARGEGRMAPAGLAALLALRAHRPIALDRASNRVEQLLLAEGLRQKLHGTGLHGPDRHRDIAVTGEEDDRATPHSL